jgi:dTDP-4-dehydrorhamnose 3,5-epimerase
MKLEKVFFKKVLLFKLKKFFDKRGNFYENYNKKELKKYVSENFIIDAISMNKKNVLRGLHYQIKYSQAKIVYVIKGQILDIVVDIRKNSKSYLQHKIIQLSERNSRMIYIPSGFAHGFLTISKEAIVAYKISNHYKKIFEKTINWNDKKIGLKIPKKYLKNIITSNKDSEK